MTLAQLFIFFILFQILIFLKLWKLYRIAGYSSYSAIIPIYNSIVLMRIIRRPTWWVILLYIPIVNLLMLPVVWIETSRSFGRDSISDSVYTLLSLGLFGFYINYFINVEYKKDRDLKAKTKFGEFIGSTIYAIIIATIVHAYFLQPFIIPTGSLEKSLLVGDFLLVSKFHYGARLPQTAISMPMMHDTIPLIKSRSYLKKPQLPYLRLPKLQKIKRNDIVVFNWPADTVRQFFKKEKRVDKPIDKKSNYVKRCVGLPGDTLSIVDGIIFINGAKSVMPYRANPLFPYLAYSSQGISSRKLIQNGIDDFNFRKYVIKNINQQIFDELKSQISVIDNDLKNFVVLTGPKGLPIKTVKKYRIQASEILESKKELFLTEKETESLIKTMPLDSLVRIIKIKTYNEDFFPNNLKYNWNEDQFGPITIPKAGASVEINKVSFPLYKKIIKDYEKNDVKVLKDRILINNQEIKTYTFKQDYFWMMGDNRHNSEDSRSWGFVPEDHIIGKPVFIWMSIDGFMDGISNWKPRWNRIFSTVGGEGERKSYFGYFIGLLMIWQVLVFVRKRRKTN